MSSFVDEVRLSLRGGDGGAGMASFARTKLKPRGNPDGGNGGHGGSVVLVSDSSIPSLAPYARKRSHRAESGGRGGPNKRHGADGSNLVMRVPVGTIARDAATGETLADLARPGVEFIAARGGRAGRGNAGLRSSVDRVPNYAERGEPGEEAGLVLELRLVADVGFVGPPNAGKSTLLGAISRAHPAVADYPFTTIDPGLGVVEADEKRFVAADLPGLIEGASEGRGLGLRFLRHATRCRVLAAVVDSASEDPAAELDAVVAEIVAFDPTLAERLRVVVANKIDLETADTEAVGAWARSRDAECVAVSAKEGTNVEALTATLRAHVEESYAAQPEAETFAVLRPVMADQVVVTREGGGFRVRSERVERLVAQTALDNPRATRRLQRRLRAMGVESALAREGAREGDDVFIGDRTFEFYPEDGTGEQARA
jgi:GTP-binding protein